MRKWIVMCLVLVSAVIAQEERELQLEFYLPDTINPNEQYTKIFKITNLDHKLGRTDNIFLTINYTIIGEGLFFQDQFEISSLNKEKTANTGRVQIEKEGTYIICGKIIKASVKDFNKQNNEACKEVAVLKDMDKTLHQSIDISPKTRKSNIKRNTNSTIYLKPYKPTIIYESSSVKSKNLVPFLILILTTAISIAAVWKD